MSKRNIHFVGDHTVNTFLQETREVENSQELYGALVNLCATTNVDKMVIFPNFRFGYLTNSSGFVCSIPKDNEFVGDVMLGEKFRVIMAAEIKLSTFTKELEERIEKLIPSSFPTESLVPPDIRNDNFASGWHPALGKRGCSIGIYKTTEVDQKADQRWDRFYIVCHTSLPDKTLNEMMELDQRTTIENMKHGDEYDNVRNLVKKSDGFVYVRDAFNSGSVNVRMSQIAIENARRLIVLYASIIGVELYRTPYQYVPAQLPKSERKKIDPETHFMKYRTPPEVGTLLDDLAKLKEAIEIWPEDVPIHGCSFIPALEDIADEFHYYPIGPVLTECTSVQPELIEKLEKKGLKLDLSPKTLEEDIFTQYNTFGQKEDGDICWYSNCADTTKADKGLLVSNGLEGGYSVLNPNFMPERKGDELLESRSSLVESTSFRNHVLNGYPVVWPFKIQYDRPIQAKSRKTFFVVNKASKPKQLLGTQVVNRELMKENSVKEDLRVDFQDPEVQNLTPVKVLLSTDTMDVPTYELSQ